MRIWSWYRRLRAFHLLPDFRLRIVQVRDDDPLRHSPQLRRLGYHVQASRAGQVVRVHPPEGRILTINKFIIVPAEQLNNTRLVLLGGK